MGHWALGIGEPVRWAGNARLVRVASPLLPKGEASAKGEATGVIGQITEC